MRLRWQHDRQPGVERAAERKRRASADLDERITGAIAAGVPVDPYALAEKLPGVSYYSARRSLMRLGLWKPRPARKSKGS